MCIAKKILFGRYLNDASTLKRLLITGFAPYDITMSFKKQEWTGPFEQMKHCYELRCHFGKVGHFESDERMAKK
jgi:hypothetical protein